jgi:hypothetical protein
VQRGDSINAPSPANCFCSANYAFARPIIRRGELTHSPNRADQKNESRDTPKSFLGVLCSFAWAQNTAITAVAWWGFAHLLRAASVTLFGHYGSVSDLISIDFANAILFTSFAETWTGARLFDHRKPQYALLFAGAAARRLSDSGLHRFMTCGCCCRPALSPLTPGPRGYDEPEQLTHRRLLNDQSGSANTSTSNRSWAPEFPASAGARPGCRSGWVQPRCPGQS